MRSKLDVIAYYNMVNGIANKKFVDEKVYDNAIKGFLFRNDQSLALAGLLHRQGRHDVGIPLKGVDEVQVIRIDGTRSKLSASGKGITVTVGEDPILLLYEGGETRLADAARPNRSRTSTRSPARSSVVWVARST